MKTKSYKIDFEIYVVFIIVISISVFNAIYSSINISNNQDVTSRIMMVDIPSLQKLENMNLLVTRSKMFTTNWVYLQSNKEDKDKLKVLQSIEYPALKGSLTSLMFKWNDQVEADSMRVVFVEFEKLMGYQKQVMNTLTSFDDYEDPIKRFTSEEIVENQVLPQSANIMSQLNQIILKKKAKTDLLHADVKASSRAMMFGVLGIAIMIVIVILIAAFYISDHIIVPTMKLKNYILQMGKGEIPEMEIKTGKNAIGQMTDAVKTLSVSLKQTAQFANTIGQGNFSVKFQPLSANDELGNALLQMRASLHLADEQNRQRNWISTGMEMINEVVRENTDNLDKLCDGILTTLSRYLEVQQGGFYLVDEDDSQIIRLQGHIAFDNTQTDRVTIRLGEGLVGQAIKSGQIVHLKNVINQANVINSGSSSTVSSHLLVIPLHYHGIEYGAVEFLGFRELQSFEIDFIASTGETIGSAISSVRVNMITKRLLYETRQQAELLRQQEEQLIRTNDELSIQSKLLQESEEELLKSNEVLKHNAHELQDKNDVLEQAREALVIKAKELELNNKFKSEFLANMSHELRTPLNSVLILAKLLADNLKQNLTEKQTEYAKVIHKSGNDLLKLINDILDLSKIEAGKIDLIPEETALKEITNDMKMLFSEIANEKKIHFNTEIDPTLPEQYVTDKMRLEQVIKNLLSNAFKFTTAGGYINFRIGRPSANLKFSNSNLYNQNTIIEFSVSDTGIGIPDEKQALIFEAFQQADGSTNRRYGGTGLGLSISKMLVSLLGGEMKLTSEQGKGSTFSFFLPSKMDFNQHHKDEVPCETIPVTVTKEKQIIEDDRSIISSKDKVLLIADEDLMSAYALLDYAHDRNYKAVIARDSSEVFDLAIRFTPSTIIMNMVLADADGLSVLSRIKQSDALKHIPVHMMSAANKPTLSKIYGANGFLKKPLVQGDLDIAFANTECNFEKQLKRILLVEDVFIHQEIIKNLFTAHHGQIELSTASNIDEAKRFISEYEYDCIVLDLDLGKGSAEGFQFLRSLRDGHYASSTPVIIFTGQDLTQDEMTKLKELSQAVVSKNAVSFDQLLEETNQFLYTGDRKEDGVDSVTQVPASTTDVLSGKTVLVVDDDMRNIYALTSILEAENMKVVTACNGLEALLRIKETLPFDIILMDIMMPEMDGYTAMKEIRKSNRYVNTPIIALTAKAMVGDKEKCIQAGASDYISKPIVAERLYSMMSIWLYSE